MFPGGPPSKYYPGPTMLNFRDLTRTGVFILVWRYPLELVNFGILFCTKWVVKKSAGRRVDILLGKCKVDWRILGEFL